MKYLGLLLIAASLVLGVISVPTAYVPPLDLPDDRLIGLTLNAPAGEVREQDLPPFEAGEPIVEPGEGPGDDVKITEELLAQLRDAGVQRIRVKEFAFNRWTGRWTFILASIGLLAGAALVRIDQRTRLAAAREHREPGREGSPEATLAAIAQTIASLQTDLPALGSEDERLHAVIDRLGQVQSEHVPAFADARELLISRMGLGGYAELMDRFAATERQINRAWSAAADGVYEESEECLQRAAVLIEQTRAVLEK